MTPPTGTDHLDIDVRFLLANERTLLAWLRTALTLQAGGVVLTHTQLAGDSAVLAGIGIGLLILGSTAGIIGYVRYRATGRAIRAGQLPAPGRGPALLTVGVVTLSAVLVAIYVLDHFVR